jgi:hypothetical protein
MHEYCHRCGGELAGGGDSPFCPHCGSPQIYLPESEQPASQESDAAADGTTGTLPPPRPEQVEWKTAIRCAVLVAAVAAVLSLLATKIQLMSPLSWLWTISGSLTTLALYQRRRPLAWMDAGVGAKIGAVVGMVLVIFLAATMTASGLVARYVLHNMAGFDAELTQQLHAQIEKTAATTQVPPEMMRYMASPEFRAGIMLAGFAIVATVLLVLSTVGGAVGGLLRMRRKLSV